MWLSADPFQDRLRDTRFADPWLDRDQNGLPVALFAERRYVISTNTYKRSRQDFLQGAHSQPICTI
jgi:hypothetical protein